MLSRKTKYAIHALRYLGEQYGKGPVLISEIAEKERVPRKFLEAILLELRNAGILSSKKGKGGGYYLRQKPEDVTMVEIVRLLDGPIAMIPCVSIRFYERCEECKDEQSCSIRAAFLEVRDKTLAALKDASIATMILQKDNNL